MQSVSIVGMGRMGGALAIALGRVGYRLDYLIVRDPANAASYLSELAATVAKLDDVAEIPSSIVIIATGDPEIGAAARSIENRMKTASVALHTSGSLDSDELMQLASHGCSVGSMHPLVSISDPVTGSNQFHDAHFCIEGDKAAVAAATDIAAALGARPFAIAKEFKPLYHAAAVTSAGHVTALFDVSIEMLTACGLDAERAKELLLPLLASTVNNLRGSKPSSAITGSFARADVEALDRHIDIMKRAVPADVLEIFLLLGERSLELAEAGGADPAKLMMMRERIKMEKSIVK